MSKDLKKKKQLIYQFICDKSYEPMKIKGFAIMFQVPKEERRALKQLLEELVEENKVRITAKGKYVKQDVEWKLKSKELGKIKSDKNSPYEKDKNFTSNKAEYGKNKSDKNSPYEKDKKNKKANYNIEDTLEGIFTAHERGFGFVTIEGREDDIFIPSDMVGGAFAGDKVLVLPFTESAQAGKRQEGKVVHIVERGVKRLVGYFERNKKFGFVKPDNVKFSKDIFIPLERSKGAVTGHKVVVEILSYGGDKKKPEGKVVEIIGHVNDPGTDILSIIKDHDLPMEFPERVLDQAQRVGKPVSPSDMEGRLDLRDWTMVTIDGEDAKDLDDGISIRKKGNYYHLGVHIADVTNYVQEKSALDREALKRGTSVYLVDRVIPMLPHVLSNGVCSLNAGEDRLALSCIMKISMDGQVVEHEIAETVIHIDERMTYTSVKNILGAVSGDGVDGKDVDCQGVDEQRIDEQRIDEHEVGHTEVDGQELAPQDGVEGIKEELEKYKDLVPMFQEMEELAAILREKRFARGAIDFDFPETKMILDKDGVPLEMKPYDRNVATKIIEEFMLLANETVSAHYSKLEVPFVYRIHEEPDLERVKSLGTFVQKFGHTMYLGEDKVSPKDLQKILDKIADTPESDIISRLILRTMKQAKYTEKNSGHFGLAAPFYSHFTSPIRRYPDLQIHRIIKEDIRHRLNTKRQTHYATLLPKVTSQCSDLERRAETAERETIKLKKAEYMGQRIGQVFTGVVGSLTKWGMYVELPNTIEGLVHVASMTDDHYEFVEETMEMVGERSATVYKLGQEVRVQVASVDTLMRTIDFRVMPEVLESEE